MSVGQHDEMYFRGKELVEFIVLLGQRSSTDRVCPGQCVMSLLRSLSREHLGL